MKKLHLGCGSRQMAGFVNVDENPELLPDVVHDLAQYPWPFESGAYDQIVCVHVLEHIVQQGDAAAFNRFFRECWRVLEPGGKLKLIVPDAHSQAAFSDPSHKSAYSREIFAFISKQSIQDNVDRGTRMTKVQIDYDFGIVSLDVVNGDIIMEAVAIK